MPLIRATRTPPGAPRAPGGPPPAVRYPALRIWPGITAGHDARCSCTRAPKDGVMQVKFRNSMCLLHGGFSRA